MQQIFMDYRLEIKPLLNRLFRVINANSVVLVSGHDDSVDDHNPSIFNLFLCFIRMH